MKIKLLFLALFLSSALIGQDAEKDMVLIPGHEFTMGKDKDGADYSPAHQVTVDSFYLDRHEVTNAEYFKFCSETGYKLPETWGTSIFRCGPEFPNHPVTGVNWYDAQKYAAWAGKRLPTEAEWEYAARGGLVDNSYPNGQEWDVPRRKNNPGENWQNLIVEVASFDTNAFGLYDMSGNVWEWVNDPYDEDYYKDSPAKNPKGPESGGIKSIRGGSWHSGAMCKRIYFRRGLPGNWVDFAVGFRCAKTL